MIELWGHPTCDPCEIAKNYLGQTPLNVKYVQVADNFQGIIPRLILENGDHIVGFPAIKQYVKRRMREMGFPPSTYPIEEGML